MVYYVINLDRRKDRLDYIKAEMERYNMPFSRFPAIERSPGWKGCRDSHIQLLKQHVNDDKPFCILEDDVYFIGDMDRLSVCMADLPYNFDCLYLGGSPQQEQEIYSENLYRIDNVICLHAVIWNPKGQAIKWLLNDEHFIQKIDVYMAKVIQGMHNCYMTRPMLCSQIQSQSDTCGRSDLSTIVSNYKKFCK